MDIWTWPSPQFRPRRPSSRTGFTFSGERRTCGLEALWFGLQRSILSITIIIIITTLSSQIGWFWMENPKFFAILENIYNYTLLYITLYSTIHIHTYNIYIYIILCIYIHTDQLQQKLHNLPRIGQEPPRTRPQWTAPLRRRCKPQFLGGLKSIQAPTGYFTNK